MDAALSVLAGFKDVAKGLYNLIDANLSVVPSRLTDVHNTVRFVVACTQNLSLAFLPSGVTRLVLDVYRELCRARSEMDLLSSKKGGTVGQWIRKFNPDAVLERLQKVNQSLLAAYEALSKALEANTKIGAAQLVQNDTARGYWYRAHNQDVVKRTPFMNGLSSVLNINKDTVKRAIAEAERSGILKFSDKDDELDVNSFNLFVVALEQRFPQSSPAAAAPVVGANGGRLRIVVHHANLINNVAQPNFIGRPTKMSPNVIVSFPDAISIEQAAQSQDCDTVQTAAADVDGHLTPSWDKELLFPVPEPLYTNSPFISLFLFDTKSEIGQARVDALDYMRTPLPRFVQLPLFVPNAAEFKSAGSVYCTVEYQPAGYDPYFGLRDPTAVSANFRDLITLLGDGSANADLKHTPTSNQPAANVNQTAAAPATVALTGTVTVATLANADVKHVPTSNVNTTWGSGGAPPAAAVAGSAIEFVVQDKNTKKWSITPAATALLKTVHTPLSVVSIAGALRAGKSYLMNRLGDALNASGKFGVTAQADPCTRGLWLRGPVGTGAGRDVSLLMVDSEGLFDTTTDNSTALFSLAISLASVMMLNTKSAIDTTMLNSLRFASAVVRAVCKQASDSKVAASFGADDVMPVLVWLVRDCHIVHDDDDKYLNDNLARVEPLTHEALDANQIRATLSHFRKKKCFTFHSPASSGVMIKTPDIPIAQTDPNFRVKFEALLDYLRDAPAKTIAYHGVGATHAPLKLDGPNYLVYVQSILDAVNQNGVPNMESSFETVLTKAANRTRDAAVKLYEVKMVEELRARLSAVTQRFRKRNPTFVFPGAPSTTKTTTSAGPSSVSDTRSPPATKTTKKISVGSSGAASVDTAAAKTASATTISMNVELTLPLEQRELNLAHEFAARAADQQLHATIWGLSSLPSSFLLEFKASLDAKCQEFVADNVARSNAFCAPITTAAKASIAELKERVTSTKALKEAADAISQKLQNELVGPARLKYLSEFNDMRLTVENFVADHIKLNAENQQLLREAQKARTQDLKNAREIESLQLAAAQARRDGERQLKELKKQFEQKLERQVKEIENSGKQAVDDLQKQMAEYRKQEEAKFNAKAKEVEAKFKQAQADANAKAKEVEAATAVRMAALIKKHTNGGSRMCPKCDGKGTCLAPQPVTVFNGYGYPITNIVLVPMPCFPCRSTGRVACN